MPTVQEGLGNQSQIAASLDAAVEQLSVQEKVEFQRYARFALDSDGSVFWVATGEKMTISGSLHYATDRIQAEDETIGTNSVLLTSEKVITQFNVINPQSMWIGTWPIEEAAPPLLIAFAQRGEFYEQAKIWHYSGFAVYPAMKTQVIDSAADLPAGPIVSNSLPIWLSMPFAASDGSVTAEVFPSFLVPDNVVPPYIVAHIDPSQTEALAAAPFFGPQPGDVVPDSGASPFYLLDASTPARDTVTLTLYGFSNAMAWQYIANLYDASLAGEFGFANSPVPVDPKRTQVELGALAQKKTVTVLANYTQGAADAVARRYILEACVSSYEILGGVRPLGDGESAQDDQLVEAEGTINE